MSTTLNDKIEQVKNARDAIKTALHNKTGETQSDDIRTYANKIADISTVNNEDKTITENGTYTAGQGYTGLGTITVNVQAQESDVFVYETAASMNADKSKNQDALGLVYTNSEGDFGTYENGVYTPPATFNKMYLPTKQGTTYKDLSKDGNYGYFDSSIYGITYQSDSENITVEFNLMSMSDPYSDPYGTSGMNLDMYVSAGSDSWSAYWSTSTGGLNEDSAYSSKTTSLFTVDRTTGLVTFNEQLKIKSINYNNVTSISLGEYTAHAWMYAFGAVISNFGGLFVYDAESEIWNPAENQLGLKSNSHLLKNISAYGNGGIFTGDGTIINEIDKTDIFTYLYNLSKDGSYYYGRNTKYPNIVIDPNWTNDDSQIRHYEKDLSGDVIIGTKTDVVKPANCYSDICAIFEYPYYRLASEKNTSTGKVISGSYILYDTRDGSVKKTMSFSTTPSPIGTYGGKTYFGGYWYSGSGSSTVLYSAVWSIDLENNFTVSTAWSGSHNKGANGVNYFAVPNKGWVMAFLDASSGSCSASVYVYDILIGAVKTKTYSGSYSGSYGWSECRAWFTQEDTYLVICAGSTVPTRILRCNWGNSSLTNVRSKDSEYLTIGFQNNLRTAYKINDALLDLNRRGENASIPLSSASDPNYYVDIRFNGESIVDTSDNTSNNRFTWVWDKDGNVIGLYYGITKALYDYTTLEVTTEPKFTSKTQYVLNFTSVIDSYKIEYVSSQMHTDMNVYGWYIKSDGYYAVDNLAKPNFYPNYAAFNKYKLTTKLTDDTVSVINMNAYGTASYDNYLVFSMKNILPDYTDPVVEETTEG